MKVQYVVITEAKNVEGNFCDDFGVEQKDPHYKGGIIVMRGFDEYAKKNRHKIRNIKRPVFHKGEILICSPGGREIVGHGRAPRKWGVKYETFNSIKDAIARAREVGPF